MPEPGDKPHVDDPEPKADTAVELADDKAQLRAQLRSTLTELKGLQAEIEKLASCKHPPAAMEGRVCGECGAEIW